MSQDAQLTPKTVALPGGLRLQYVEQGDPSGVPLILLHGYSDSLRSYELLLAQLPDSVHAYAITQRGHGDSDRPRSGYRPEDHAADVEAFLDAMELDAAIVVGHSGGSYTAQRFGLDHPDRALGLVLVGAFRTFEGDDVRELLAVVEGLDDPVDANFVREFQQSTLSQPVPAEFFERIVAESRKLPARVWRTFLRDMTEAAAPSEAGTIAVPTLMLWGDQDLYCPRAEQEALAAAIPGARLVTYAGVGHCPHWEMPARAARDIVAFAHRQRARRGLAARAS